MCGVKTCATLDKENVRKVFLKIKQHNVIMASKIAYNYILDPRAMPQVISFV